MAFLLSRILVTPIWVTCGLLVMIGGELGYGTWIAAIGFGYWLVAGWVGRFRKRRVAARPTAQFTAQVTTISSRARRSDGANGAFSRLDPAWQDWLREEATDRGGNP